MRPESERKMDSPSLNVSSDQLLDLIDQNVADLIAVIDSDAKRVWHNEAYCRTLGYSRQELAAEHSQVRIHPDDREEIGKLFAHAMETGETHPCTYRMEHRTGGWVHLESNARVVQLPEFGRCLILVARDISERVKLENQLKAELAEAADYVRSLLPPPLDRPVRAHWRFVPSNSLGGDAFFYDWETDDDFRFGLLDVCGHGMGAALLSISAVNCLRSKNLPRTDFMNPVQVLEAMNRAFPMEQHGQRFFTMWYGVYNRKSRQLVFASAGHPAAYFIDPVGGASHLKTDGGAIGLFPETVFNECSIAVPKAAVLYLFSDGVFELTTPDGKNWPLTEFLNLLLPKSPQPDPEMELDRIMKHTRQMTGCDTFEDDYSMLRLTFE